MIIEKYNILPDRTSTNGLTVLFDPADLVTTSFFRSLRSDFFPSYVLELTKGSNFGGENASFVFFDQMDWEDKAEFNQYFGREIDQDEMRIRVYDGTVRFSVLKKKDFLHIFYDYSTQLLNLYRSADTMHDAWKDEMISCHALLAKLI